MSAVKLLHDAGTDTSEAVCTLPLRPGSRSAGATPLAAFDR